MTIYDHAELYDLIDTQEDTAFYVEEALKAQGECLELACGTGRALIPIAKQGVTITGIELSGAMLEGARAKVAALDASVQSRISLVQGDMRSFNLAKQFALIMIPFQGFLHLLTVDEQLETLANIHRHLAPNAKLILDFKAGRWHAADLAGLNSGFKHWFDMPNPKSDTRFSVSGFVTAQPFLQQLKLHRIIKEINAQGSVISEKHIDLTSRVMYRHEFEHLVIRCGFEIEAVYGSFERDAVHEESQTLIWVLKAKN